MPDNKKHHYVPKFYLRNFSPDTKSIGIFNIPKARLISSGNLANQCYQNYLYGRNPILEKSLSTIEGAAASVIREIIDKNECPPRFSDKHHALITFVALQASRTLYAEAELNEMTEKLIKALMPPDSPNLASVHIELTNAVYEAMRSALLMAPILYDLDYKLLLNETETAFITCDNPVALHNQYWEPDQNFGHLGWATEGLQIFLPISPGHTLLFYDDDVYKVGRDGKTQTSITRLKDVVVLNTLQWLNALENIYFAAGQEDRVVAQSAIQIPRRQVEKTNFAKFASAQSELRSLLMFSKPNKKLTVQVSAISISRRPKQPQHIEQHPPTRNSAYTKIVRDFADAVKQGRASVSDFNAFKNAHPLMRALRGG